MGKHSNHKLTRQRTRKNGKYINKTMTINTKKSRNKSFNNNNDDKHYKQGGNSTNSHTLNKIQIKKIRELQNYYPIFNTQLQDETSYWQIGS